MRRFLSLATVLLGTMLMVGCTENSPTESIDSSAFVGQPESPGRPGFAGPPEEPGPPEQPGQPGEVCVPFESLVGEWTLTSFTLDGLEIDFGGTSFVFTFLNDGRLTESVTGDTGDVFCDPGPACTENNRYIQTDVNLLICDPGCDEPLDYSIAGNTLAISFDGNGEDPPLTATFVRTSASGRPDLLCGPAESLVGEWTVTSVMIDGGPELIVEGLSFVWVFFSDGTQSEFISGDDDSTFCDDAATECSDLGSGYIQTDVNLLICDPGCDPIIEYSISGNTMDLFFDGGEEEDPSFTASLVRT